MNPVVNEFDVGSVNFSKFDGKSQEGSEESRYVKIKLRNFIRDFRDTQRPDLMTNYRDQLSMNYNQGKYFLEVDYGELQRFDAGLAEKLRKEPEKILKLFETAAKETQRMNLVNDDEEVQPESVKNIQIKVVNFTRNADSLRTLGADHVSTLVQVPGIVISAGKVKPRAIRMRIRCTNCQRERWVQNVSGFGTVTFPRTCETSAENENVEKKCPLDPFVMVPDKCVYIDTQRLKLQENPEDVPTGEMPRHMSLCVDREYVDKIKPGSRVNIIGVYDIYQPKIRGKSSKNKSSIRQPYLKVIGVEETNPTEVTKGVFAAEEEEALVKLGDDPEIYEKVWKSVAPNIFGHEDVKKAIACLMFGGSRKHLMGGTKLRGDINVLLLGDPSVAKSQFLKYVHQVAPIGVYTSGKGSSAAGLTASVIRDPASGEFRLEGGAMVLADGGIVCIDEFDKMREDDRISIHEAMEQQTISIAKAGITTTLNSRCSVLAAANPIFGRYDDMRSVSENIDFQSTILSRFDLIFILRDHKDMDLDRKLAMHIMDFHINVDQSASTLSCPIDSKIMSKYVAYARTNIHPRLNQAAAEMLKNEYVNFRQTAKKREESTGQQSAIPITVRQLEAIVRISEALARMELSEVATEDHVKEAVRLFRFATMKAVRQGHLLTQAGPANDDFMKNVQDAEELIRKRIAIGSQIPVKKCVQDLKGHGVIEQAAIQALHFMFLRREIEYFSGRRMLRRLK